MHDSSVIHCRSRVTTYGVKQEIPITNSVFSLEKVKFSYTKMLMFLLDKNFIILLRLLALFSLEGCIPHHDPIVWLFLMD